MKKRVVVLISECFYRCHFVEADRVAAFVAGFHACEEAVGGGADTIGLYVLPDDEEDMREDISADEIAKALAVEETP